MYLKMIFNMTIDTQNHYCVEREKYYQRSIESNPEYFIVCYHGAGLPQRAVRSRHAPKTQKSASKASGRPRRRCYKSTLPAFQRDN